MSASRNRLNGPQHCQTGWQTGQRAPQQVNTAPEWTATGQTAPEQVGNQSASQDSDSPDSDTVGVSDGLNLCLGCKFELEAEANVDDELGMEKRHGTPRHTSAATMELDNHSGCRKTTLLMRLN